MPTRQELVLQFILQLAANASIQVTDAQYVYQIACSLADQYIGQQA
jgi:hypothetical protein